ncbi:amidohydrolase [Rhodoferax sediminis]|uniref:Amidohydrolase n=1 Tax=Rhodoferax sediminis TaxID=2509614 RepID=A0A515DDF9_9BURK|nr:amidohydrolase [Rhodoferax sediminis]QDL38446.1 amidohydrolase [Rhodoferax sediminis]
MTHTTVYSARKIITMNPMQPEATHVAVRDGRILAVGDLERMQAWGAYTLDERFADKVLMPGLVEGHSHLMAGGLWLFPFVGFHARTAPDGKVWSGCHNFDEVVARLIELEAQIDDPAKPLLAWGFDPIFFGAERMTVHHLDRVSATRPVVILHASQHLMNVNSAAMAAVGITRETEVEGIARFDNGEPTGELQEFAAMFPIARLTGNIFRIAGTTEQGLRLFGQVAQLAGVTTATDLVNDLSDNNVEVLQKVTAEADFPVRLVPAYIGLDGSTSREAGAARVRSRVATNTDKLHFGLVKIVTDGSIQGFTARVRWPGYFNGHDNGIWIQPPAELKATIAHFHAAGFQLHIHTNGDEATELAIDGIEEALATHPRADHRHTLQHCQMADAAQFRRMARLGICANLFANHIYYWGDAHHALTMGPDRAERMDACATALEHGVPLAIHSDAPITPLGPLFTAWCAVNRLTSSSRVLGASERISVADALQAITLGAAFTLGLDDRIGSIEVRKFADFCVLDEDPLAVVPEALKDLRIAGTVLGGRVLELPGSTPGK